MADGGVWFPDFCGNVSRYDQFWSRSLTINTAHPRLTDCFEDIVLTWAPCFGLWLVAPFYVTSLVKTSRRHGRCTTSLLTKAKLIFSSILAAVGFLRLILPFVHSESHPAPSPARSVSCVVFMTTMVLITFIMALEYQRGMHTSKLGLFFWFGMTLTQICILISHINRVVVREEAEMSDFVIHISTTLFVVFELVLQFFREDKASHKDALLESTPLLAKTPADALPPVQQEHPEMHIPYIQTVLRCWCFRVLYKGYRRPLTFNDIYILPKSLTSAYIVPLFEDIWNDALKKSSWNHQEGGPENIGSRPPSLILLLLRHILGILLVNFLCLIIYCVAGYIMVFLVPLLITYIDSGDTYLWQGITLTVLFFVFIQLRAFIFYSLHQHNSVRAGITLRTILISAVFKKATRLSNDAKKRTTIGEITNMMSVEAYKFLYFPMYFDNFYCAPFDVTVCIVLFYFIVGPACFAGLLFLLLAVPLNTVLVGKIHERHQKKQTAFQDRRVKLLNEIITGIKVLKLYAWEVPFESRLNSFRKNEVRELRMSTLAQGIGIAVWFLVPWLTQQVVIATYVLLSPDHVLDAQTAFMSLTLSGLLAYGLQFLPFGLSHGVQAITAANRIEKFLLLSEEDPQAIGNNPRAGFAVTMENCSFSWGTNENAVLKDLEMLVPRGELVAVVGRVGSGKSSLLAAMLGELTKLSGSIQMKGRVGYVPQQPWIQNATLRDNILFGSPYYRTLYENVVEACSLKFDFEILPAGDLTEIGEKGINLSGGQKQRVSLARAVYQNPDVVLLDDTLSAVDVHVGRHIFEKVIGPRGLLSGKTRILVTHGVNFLPQVDRIIVLSQGCISESGTFDDLIQRNGAFADFIKTYLTEEATEEDTDPEVLDIIESHYTSLSESESQTELKSVKRRHKKRSPKLKVVEDQGEDRLITEETAQTGHVSFRVIRNFLQSAGTCTLCALVLSIALVVTCNTTMNIWLSEWTNDVTINATAPHQVAMRLTVYTSLGGAQVLMCLIVACVASLTAVAASEKAHRSALSRVLRSPMRFFETTPTGRILNRLSTDIDVMDTILPPPFMSYIFGITLIVTTFAVICYSTPLFLVAGIPVLIGLIFLQRFFRNSLRQSKRLEATALSPLYSHLEATLTGASVIKAFQRRPDFISKCHVLLDKAHMAYYQFSSLQQCVSIYYAMAGSIIVVLATLFAVLDKDNMSGSMAGLSISFGITAITSLNLIMSLELLVETGFISLERISEYNEIESEASWDSGEVTPPSDWPNAGLIELQNFSTRYRPGLDLVIRDMSCKINAGEKIGVVGRTGAGKSSLTLALFRLIEPSSGQILIDNIDVSKIGLHQLRDKITIIPQDPVLFSGNLRENLDPFAKYTDGEVLRSLEQAHLRRFYESLKGGLDYDVGERGDKLSVGERQLVCLARALLKKNKILVLDEATAAVDLTTDDLIQNTIRTCFPACTIITIAHRISTITDYDRVLVMEKGRITEFDSPKRLLQNQESMFHGLASEAGLI